ncbi:MAG: putative metal-binding motif-containing protein [Saprospiraceae bacterium]|nr:putative metal-binding motif-containing protein [Saprospiraceae bacterium]
MACSPPNGYATDNTDCNDNNVLINPGATEICNGLDDDCDGDIDEGVQNTYCADTDNDGYGDAPVTTMACSPLNGYVADNTDCNDNNVLVNPGAQKSAMDWMMIVMVKRMKTF